MSDKIYQKRTAGLYLFTSARMLITSLVGLSVCTMTNPGTNIQLVWRRSNSATVQEQRGIVCCIRGGFPGVGGYTYYQYSFTEAAKQGLKPMRALFFEGRPPAMLAPVYDLTSPGSTTTRMFSRLVVL